LAERTPAVLVTGFLGSGKTTLISALLEHPELASSAVIVNELGEVPIDHHLVRRVDERTVVLPGGCVCCALRADLADTLRDLARRRDRNELPQFRRVVIETTGLADPAPIIGTFLSDPHVQHHYSLDHVVTTVAAVHAVRGPELVKQVVAADRLVITKTDLAGASDLAAELRELNPTAEIVEASFGEVEPERLLEGPGVDLREVPAEQHSRPHGIDAVCLEFEQPLDWTAFGMWLTMLLAARGGDILRVKGLLDPGGDTPVLVNGVQHVVHPPAHLDGWPDEDRRSRIVFIGRGLRRHELQDSLAAFDRALRAELAP
jgi:G3E family GTPase